MRYFFIFIKNISILTVVLLLFYTISCVDPIQIEIPEEDPLLIVDGLITDQPGPYVIKLALSSPINQLSANPVTQASVFIEEEGGEVVTLIETNPGEYKTDSASFRGKVGKKYKLNISLSTGQNYKSNWELMKAAPPIEDVSYEFGPLPNEEIFVQGVKIFLDTKDPENKTQFYRWEYEETWMHIAPFASGLIFLGNDTAAIEKPNSVCYNSSNSNSIYIASSIKNSQDIISKFHLHTVSGFGSQLRYRYSILVKQYALSEDEFLFWKSVKEANEDSGTLFDRQPQSTTGNITRIENEDEPVLGYFSASGYSEKRLFISRAELPAEAVIGEQYVQNCYVKTDTLPKGLASEQDVWESLSLGKIFFNFWRDPDIVGWILTTKDCADCTEAGGTIEEPDFW